MRPFVLAPQTKNVPASSQKAFVRDACASAARGAIGRGGAAEPASCRWPYGRSPMSSGRSRMNSRTSTNTITAAPATTNAAVRHPLVSMTLARNGRNTSCPVAFAADSAPRTTPRRSSNHRVATTAASTIDVTPVPAPTSTPQHSTSCHSVRICVDIATDAARRAMAHRTTLFSPQRSITDAANGPMRPKRAMLTATAPEMTARLQPNSLSSGTKKRPGVARTPAVMSSTANVTSATIHP